MSDNIPRRSRLDLLTPAETAIREAIIAVETAGCDVRLTRAINKLSEATSLVADYVDGVPAQPRELPQTQSTAGVVASRAADEERLTKERAKLRWCVHILGPDELIAKESYEAAEKHASELSDFLFRSDKPDVLCLPIVAMWPWSDAAHQEALAEDATRCASQEQEPKP